MRHILLLFLVAHVISLAAAESSPDRLEADEWFVGELAGQPAISIHQVATRHGDGRRTTRTDLVLAILRRIPVPGQAEREIRFELRDGQTFVESASGAVLSFRFERDENGSRTTAFGAIKGAQVTGTLQRLGRSEPVAFSLPDGVVPVGDRRMQDLLTTIGDTDGDQLPLTSLVLVDAQVLPVAMIATYRGLDDRGRLQIDVLSDMLPVTTRYLMLPKGGMVGMEMKVLGMTLAIRPNPGPVALLGAALNPSTLVTAVGEPPAQGEVWVQLPPGAMAPDDEFQTATGAVMQIRAVAVPSALPDPQPWLQAEPSLELDDPALRAWVDNAVLAERGDRTAMAERLRTAVRSHISGAEFDVGDGSALETFRRRRGDCTEHANLLCAALRIAGIPARVDVGLVWYERQHAWIGHAWTSAWVDGSWLHLDSAMPGIPRSRYLKLATVTGGTVKESRGRLVGLLGDLAGKPLTFVPAP